MTIKIKMKLHPTTVRIAIRKTTINKCLQGCGEKETLLYCGWVCNLVQSLWKIVWIFLNYKNIDTIWHIISFLDIHLTETNKRSTNSKRYIHSMYIVVQSLRSVQYLTTPWTEACQVSLFFTTSRRFLKVMSIESVMISNHFILCCPILLTPIFPSTKVFSNESVLCIR